MTRILPLVLAALVVVAGGAWYMSQQNAALPGISIAEAQENTGDAPSGDGQDAAAEIVAAPDIILGDPEAPVTLIEYASYTCPHCANFQTDVAKQLKRDYVETGKVRFIHREVYFDQLGLMAGIIARCGGEERYYGLSDLIYTGQREWIGSGQPEEVLDNLMKIGRLAGMSDEQMTTCLNDQTMAKSLIMAYQANAEAHGINATPTLVINGQKHSNMSYDELKGILDGLLTQ